MHSLQGELWSRATVFVLFGLPLLIKCAPAPDRFGGPEETYAGGIASRQLLDGLDGLLNGLPLSEAAITETVVSTVLETRTATTFTTVVTASTLTDASPVSSSDPSNSPYTATGEPVQATTLSLSSISSQPSQPVSSSAPGSTVTQTVTVTPMAPTSDSMPTSSSVLLPTPMQSSDPPPIAAPPPTSSSGPTPSSTTVSPPISVSSPSSSASASPISSDAPANPSDSPSADLGVFKPGQSTQHATRPASQKPLVMAYYPDWAASAFPPENIDFKRFDWIDFAFAVPTQTFGLGWDGDDNSADLLRRLVTTAHQNGKRVKLSVGGWTGSKYFSPAVSTPKNRQTFANNILAVYNQFGLDGIDIDWEFPAQDGNKGNIKSPNDTANFLAFLQLLRKTLPPAAKISAATMTVPWSDPQGNPSRDVSGFASVLDWILVMNYDTWGSSSVPGPNAPLSNACHNSTQSAASAVAAVMSWTSAGFPASKIVMGVPSYGYISRSGSPTLMTRSFSRSKRAMPSHVPMHIDGANQSAASEAEISTFGEDPLEDPLAQAEGSGSSSAYMVRNEDGGTEDGQVQFRDLVNQKVLQYLSAWTTSAMSTMAVDGEAAGDNSDEDQGAHSEDSPAESHTSFSDSLNGDSSNTDDGSDGSSQLGATSVAFAGQQIINVFNGQKGFVRQWDACSSSPFLRSASARQVITYDDPQSLEMKAVFVRAAGLLGVNMFDVHGDTDQWDLTDGIRRGLGL